MKTEIYWIRTATPGRLAIMPRPRGGDWLEDEVLSWRAAGVDRVVSLLTAEEVLDLGLRDEEALCNKHAIALHSFPIPDRGTPASRSGFLRLVEDLATELSAGKNIAIHCRQGIGRAPLVAMGILVLTGVAHESALKAVAEARGCGVPETAEQRRWFIEFAQGVPTAARG